LLRPQIADLLLLLPAYVLLPEQWQEQVQAL
jgi:hypothetical protein